MNDTRAERILANPTFQRMARKKATLGWAFTILMLIVYFSYIGYIAISPETFAKPVSAGAITTWGIYAGLFVIIFAFVLTGIYVYKANGEFEQLTRDALKETESLS